MYVEALQKEDLLIICSHAFPDLISTEVLMNMISFNCRIQQETMEKCNFGTKGKPWEFNLRDVFRWLQIMRHESTYRKVSPSDYIDFIYSHRMRTMIDRQKIYSIYQEYFGEYQEDVDLLFRFTPFSFQIGNVLLPRQDYFNPNPCHILFRLSPYIKSLARCIQMQWMAILVGESGSGKTDLVRFMANASGNRLVEIPVNESNDAMDLLGGFEQVLIF